MPRSFAYYASRLHDRALQWLIACNQPAHSHFAIAAYAPGTPEDAFRSAAGPETAFVFQGPVAADFETTFKTYRTLFPESPIIVSTWESERPKLEWLQSDTTHRMVFLAPPTKRGIMNVNLQIWSTGHGIRAVRDHFPRVRRVAKLRSDYAPHRPDELFPVIDHFDAALGGSRIWGVDINTSAALPFSFSDIFQIGPIEEMLQFWTLEDPDDRDMTPAEFLARTANQTDIDAVIRLQPAEIFLTLRYLAHKSSDLRADSVADYHRMLGRYFGILDADQIGLAFDKYTPWRNGRSPEEIAHKRFISFPAWLRLALAGRPSL